MLQFQLWKKLLVAVVLLGGVVYALPNLVNGQAASILPGEKINLGLDLRGGSHLLLRVDIDAVRQERLDTIAETIRQEFRGAKIRFSGLDVRDNSVVVKLRDASDADAAQSIINGLGQGVSLTRDNDNYRIAFNDAGMIEMQTQTVQQSIEIIRRRLDPKGTKEPVIQRQGLDRVLVQLPGVDDPEAVKRLLGRTAKLTFQLVDSRMTAAEAIDRGRTPPGTVLLQSASDDGRSYVVEKRVMVSGEMLDSASAGIDQNNRPAVNFALNTVGARKFGKVTGDFTVAETNELALILRAGALPAPLIVMEERSIGPGLGADSVAAGEIAAVIGLVLVAAYMVASYGLFGVLADVALVANIVLIIAALSALQATLTLPGIAGIVLTMGMAVDANVLIFERIREELARGRSVLAAIDGGYQRALSTIVDSNLTTLFAALFLYIFGSGPIKGFAVTLAIGIVTSLFTAVMVTRLLIILWVERKRPSKIIL